MGHPLINLPMIFSGSVCPFNLYLVILVQAACGGDVTLTTDMLTALATDEPAYVFASPGKYSWDPDLLTLRKHCCFSFKCKQLRQNLRSENSIKRSILTKINEYFYKMYP